MYEYTVLRRRFIFEGNELIRLKISLPTANLPPSIREFYSNLSSNFIKWCEEAEFPLLCREYNESSKQKYIYRKKLYSVSAEITYLSDTLISVFTCVSKEQARVFSEYQCWDVKRELLLPPKYALALLRRELKEAKIPPFSKKIRSVGTDGAEVFTC